MANIKTEIVEFLQVFIKDIEHLVDRQELIINRPTNVIAVWEELNRTITSTINHITTISLEELIANLNETGLSITQIEWEIENCRQNGFSYHNIMYKFFEGSLVEKPASDLYPKALRPLLRWYNITIGSLSYSFPKLGPVKDFIKAITQELKH